MQHILYFAGYRLTVYRWENSGFTGVAQFEPDESGFASFERLLHREVNKPLRMIIDVIEEDFRLETIPHVIGTDKKSLLERTLNKNFRMHPHRYITIQGRETTGRKDDIVMMSAITNPELYKNWLDIIARNKIPFEGIYSLPFIGELLLKPLGAHKGKTLLISQQVPSNIRQSFYVDGQLKLSRQAPSQDDAMSHSEVLVDETERTVRYLENQHMYNTGDPFNIFVIVPMSQAADTAKSLRSDTYKTYHVVSRETLAKELGIKQHISGSYSDSFFAHVLLKNKKQAAHYVTAKEKKYFYHHKANLALKVSAALIALVAISLSAIQFIEGIVNSSEIPNLQQETRRFQQLEKQTLSAISDVEVDVNDIRDVVELAEKIEANYKFDPFVIINEFAKVLNNNKNINIDKLDWVSTYDHSNNLGESREQLDKRLLKRLERKKIHYQKIKAIATIDNFDNNPRLAVEQVINFKNELSKNTKFTKVEIIKMPFDLAPDTRFQYQAISELSGNKDSSTTFEIILTIETES